MAAPDAGFELTSLTVNGTEYKASYDATNGYTFTVGQNGNIRMLDAYKTLAQGADIAATFTSSTPATVNLPLAMQGGWNWISVNVENNVTPILDQIKTAAGANGLQLNGKNNFLKSFAGMWMGTLTTISSTTMYQAELQNNQTITVTGDPVNAATTPIAINYGDNWIGYTPQFPLSVNDALAGINAPDKDLIKGQTGYAIRYGTDWLGTLTDMEPGKGYIYQTENTTPKTLTYPSVAPLSAVLRSTAASHASVTPKYKADAHRYPNNMTVTSIVVDGDSEARNSQLEIAAFSDNEVRGSMMLQYVAALDRYIGFVLVSGKNGEKITLKVYDHATGKEREAINPPLTFAPNAIHGNLLNPYPVTLHSSTGTDPVLSQIDIYPNPVHDRLYVSRPVETIDLIEIMDLNGRSMLIQKDFNAAYINVSALEQGIYLLRMTVNRQTIVKRFIKK
jgi:hypothetical protein